MGFSDILLVDLMRWPVGWAHRCTVTDGALTTNPYETTFFDILYKERLKYVKTDPTLATTMKLIMNSSIGYAAMDTSRDGLISVAVQKSKIHGRQLVVSRVNRATNESRSSPQVSFIINAAVTAFSRFTLSNIRALATHLNHRFVYSDTDSAHFIDAPKAPYSPFVTKSKADLGR